MELDEPILKILRRKYEPSSFIETRFNVYDLAFKTDKEGHAMVLCLGKKDEYGHIQGERFTRRLKQLTNGTILKCHWEHKGSAE